MKIQEVLVLSALVIAVGACTPNKSKTGNDSATDQPSVASEKIEKTRDNGKTVKTVKTVKTAKKSSRKVASVTRSKVQHLHRNPAATERPMTPTEDDTGSSTTSGMTSGPVFDKMSGTAPHARDLDTTGPSKTYENSRETGTNP
jgi:hypothetical protein